MSIFNLCSVLWLLDWSFFSTNPNQRKWGNCRIARRKGRTTTVYMLIQMHITCNSHKKLYKKYCHLYFTNKKQSQDTVDGFFFKNTKQENNKPTFLGKCQSHWTRRMAFQILLYDSSTSSPPTSRNRLIFKSST